MTPRRYVVILPSRRTRRHPPRISSTAVRRRPSLLRAMHLLLLASQILLQAAATESSTIPRSANRYSNYPDGLDDDDDDASPRRRASSHRPEPHPQHPPWNPSPQIDPAGYLAHLYPRVPGAWEPAADLRGRYGPRSKTYASLSSVPVRIRQVPGDGNCLFHSIAVGLGRVEEGTDLDMATAEGVRELRRRSRRLRNRAVDALEGRGRKRLFLQGDECLDAKELLTAAAAQFDLEGAEYCDLMRRESYWGGGPEIVALCNCLRRPIHIYELVPAAEPSADAEVPSPIREESPTDARARAHPRPLSAQFALRRMACFGSPKFDRREPLHILSADSRFPDVEPRKIRKVGNHFLALFPLDEEENRKLRRERGEARLRRRHALIRGGTTNDGRGERKEEEEEKKDRVEKRSGEVCGTRSKERVGRWDGGKGSWSVRGRNPFFLGERDEIDEWTHRMERMVFPPFHWLVARLVSFAPISGWR